MLNSERMYTAIVTAYLQPSMRKANGAYKLDIGQKSLYPDKVLILIAMLQVLTRHFNLIKFLESEFAERDAVCFQADGLGSTIKLFFEFVPPFTQLVNVLVHSGLLRNKVFLKRAPDVRGKDGLGELADICFGSWR